MKPVAFLHKKSGEIHITAHPDGYANRKEWKPVPVPKAEPPSAEAKRRDKIASMSSVERFDQLQAEMAELRARLDKAGL